MKVFMTKVIPAIGLFVQVLFIVDMLIELYKKYKPKMKETTAHSSSIDNKTDEI